MLRWPFLPYPTLELRHPDGTRSERGYLVIGNEEYIITLPVGVWNSRKDLADLIGGYGALVFTGSNAHIAHIRQYITDTTPELPFALGVQTYGLHAHEGRWTELYADRPFNV